jgi:hydroxyacylglutathione hydrolase
MDESSLPSLLTPSGSALQIYMFPCLQDNYCYLVNDSESGITGVIDTPEVQAIEHALADTGWTLDYILNTHHHFDHAGGNLQLKEKTGCTIVGPKADKMRIPGIDITVAEGDTFELGSRKARIHDTPGHTRGHIVYHFEDDREAFVGDTLFAMGCGRLFEGTADQMWSSLQKIMRWPDETRIYCAHEYTQTNARFALTVEPGNRALVDRAADVDRLREQGLPTIPTTIKLEKDTNPFLRPDSPNLQATLAMQNASVVDVFAETRKRKDRF